MNNKLEKVQFDLYKLIALMYAYENTYLGVQVIPEDAELASNGESAFYAIWDAIKLVKTDLDELEKEEFLKDIARIGRKNDKT